jgi:hypothetical protein
MLGSEKGAGGGAGLAGSSPSAASSPDIRSSASKTLKARLPRYSSVSTPTFLTMGFQILSGIQAGALLGLCTCTRLPVNTCSVFVPRSSRLSSYEYLATVWRSRSLTWQR